MCPACHLHQWGFPWPPHVFSFSKVPYQATPIQRSADYRILSWVPLNVAVAVMTHKRVSTIWNPMLASPFWGRAAETPVTRAVLESMQPERSQLHRVAIWHPSWAVQAHPVIIVHCNLKLLKPVKSTTCADAKALLGSAFSTSLVFESSIGV